MRCDAAIPAFAEDVGGHFFELGLFENVEEVVACVDKELDMGTHVGQGEGVVGCCGRARSG